MKSSILEEAICHRIPIQTLLFLIALPTYQDGIENHDKVYFPLNVLFIILFIYHYYFTFISQAGFQEMPNNCFQDFFLQFQVIVKMPCCLGAADL